MYVAAENYYRINLRFFSECGRRMGRDSLGREAIRFSIFLVFTILYTMQEIKIAAEEKKTIGRISPYGSAA